jgi:hypothetical protein
MIVFWIRILLKVSDLTDRIRIHITENSDEIFFIFSAELNSVKTVEPLSGAEVLRQELAIKSLTSQMEAFDRRELRHTQPVERNSLPDADTLRQERGKADLLSGMEQAYLLVTCGVVSGPPRRRVEDTSGLCSGLPSSPGGLDRLSRRAFHID